MAEFSNTATAVLCVFCKILKIKFHTNHHFGGVFNWENLC